MADINTTSSSQAAAPVLGDASTPATAIDSPLTLPAPGTPVDIDSLLAGSEATEVLGTETPSEAGGGKTDGEPVKADKPEGEPDTTTTTTETEGDPEEKEEAEEAADIERAKDEKGDFKWVPKRLSKMAEQKRALREENAQLKAEKQAREEAEAQAAANPNTPLPASAIAHLDTEEKLTEAVNTAVNNLKWAETRNGFEKYFADDGEDVPGAQTAEQKFQAFKADQLFILSNQEAQKKLLTQRQATLEEVRKSVPAMFKPGTEEHAFYEKARNTDPRTDPEFHQLMADALRGRKARLELAKATASKVTVKKDVKAPPIPVPSVATARASVRTDDAPDARQQVWQKAAKQEAVSVDEMMDAGALAA